MSYTLVQHSGYGYGNDIGFRRAVEFRSLTNGEETLVRRMGGTIIDSYDDIDMFAQIVNYPPSVEGMYPRCEGNFIAQKIDGLCFYLPSKNDILRFNEAQQEVEKG